MLPFLYQKDMIESISLPSNYNTITRATASRISESMPQRYSPALYKSKSPTPYVVFQSKRIVPKPVPIYKKETVASKMNKWDAELDREETVLKPKFNPRPDSKVLELTIATRQKINVKFVESKFEIPRPKTNIKQNFINYSRKTASPRPYRLMNSTILFNPLA